MAATARHNSTHARSRPSFCRNQPATLNDAETFKIRDSLRRCHTGDRRLYQPTRERAGHLRHLHGAVSRLSLPTGLRRANNATASTALHAATRQGRRTRDVCRSPRCNGKCLRRTDPNRDSAAVAGHNFRRSASAAIIRSGNLTAAGKSCRAPSDRRRSRSPRQGRHRCAVQTGTGSVANLDRKNGRRTEAWLGLRRIILQALRE